MILLAKQPHQESHQPLPWEHKDSDKGEETRLDTCPQWKKEEHTWKAALTKGAKAGRAVIGEERLLPICCWFIR